MATIGMGTETFAITFDAACWRCLIIYFNLIYIYLDVEREQIIYMSEGLLFNALIREFLVFYIHYFYN